MALVLGSACYMDGHVKVDERKGKLMNGQMEKEMN